MAHVFSTARQRSRTVEQPYAMRGLVEIFIFIQFLLGVLLFLPGAQQYRMYIRALPYLSSFILFALYYGSRRRYNLSAAGKFVVLALLLLVINLAHPQTQTTAGMAQCAFQFCIVAPVFWAGKAVRNPKYLNRLLWLIFAVSAASSLIGLLQIYFPQYFMPPEFSALAQSMNRDMIESLTYEGASGQKIIRPPGLSDMPGGAAVAGMMTAVMGIALGMRHEWKRRTRLLCLALAGVGMVTLYLTQVRALFLLMVAAVIALCALIVRCGQRREGIAAALISACLLVGSFVWALTIGGTALSERFLTISEAGLLNSFQTNRGIFVEDTLNNLLFQYPMGAGLGRWGMMSVYFGDEYGWDSQPIHVEIQMTGWLLDGGVLMWLFYGGALAAALLYAYRQAVSTTDRDMKQAARLVFCLLLIIVGTSFAGPAFNTQLGVQFWFLSAALHGTGTTLARAARNRTG